MAVRTATRCSQAGRLVSEFKSLALRARCDQEHRLRRIIGVAGRSEDPSADGVDQAAVALEQGGEGSLVPIPGEGMEQHVITQVQAGG